MHRVLLLALALGVSLCAPVHAAVFCARTSAELSSALATVGDNNEADEIRIAIGTFNATTAAPFRADIWDGKSLTIRGGWSLLANTCFTASNDARKTVLDGGAVMPSLWIRVFEEYTPVQVSLESATLRNGTSNASNVADAAGLAIIGFAKGNLDIRVDRVVVHGHVSSGGLRPTVKLVSDDGFIRFSNSIVRNNFSDDNPAIYIAANSGGSALSGLTVINNTRTGANASAIEWSGVATGLLYGSVFFGNAGGVGDLQPTPRVQVAHTRYGTLSGGFNSTSYSNYAITDPQFESATVPRPTASSSLRNVLGTGAGVGRYDVFGQVRDLEGYVDIGAAEGVN